MCRGVTVRACRSQRQQCSLHYMNEAVVRNCLALSDLGRPHGNRICCDTTPCKDAQCDNLWAGGQRWCWRRQPRHGPPRASAQACPTRRMLKIQSLNSLSAVPWKEKKLWYEATSPAQAEVFQRWRMLQTSHVQVPPYQPCCSDFLLAVAPALHGSGL